MSGFGESGFGEDQYDATSTPVHRISLFELGLILESREDEDYYNDFSVVEYADDGWPIPPPCIIDGTPMNCCTHDYGTPHITL